MPMNRIQFQPVMSLFELFQQFGTGLVKICGNGLIIRQLLRIVFVPFQPA